MFIWSRSPDPAWVRDLRAISPLYTRLSHLELWWEAGLPWAPVQRWVLYQLQPLEAMTPWAAEDWGALMDLEQPCRCAWEWSHLPAGVETSPETVRCGHCHRIRTQARTNIFAAWERGYHAQPFWMIQGSTGGHKVRYSTQESEIAAELGIGKTPPAPGSLPYAPYDARVRRRIVAYDATRSRMRSLKGARKEHRDALNREARRLQELYLTGAIAEAKDQFADHVLDEIPMVHGGPRGADEAEASARYIETGRL